VTSRFRRVAIKQPEHLDAEGRHYCRRVEIDAPESQAADRFVLVPTGEGGLQPGVELSSNAALREILDEGLDIDMLR
jgi:hypothetical protein